MKHNKLKKANAYRISQELLRNKALKKGVNLIAPETIFLSNDTYFGKNVTIEPFVVIGSKVKIGDNSLIKSFTHIEGAKIEKNVNFESFMDIFGIIFKLWEPMVFLAKTIFTSAKISIGS